MGKISGNCLCGAVAFEVNDDFQRLNLCHCEQCRKLSGSAHAANLFTDPDNLRWTKGEDRVKRFDVPGRSFTNAFCADCGSRLPWLAVGGKLLLVPAGALNEAYDSNPITRNIFWSERAEWYEAATKSERRDTFR